MLGISLSSYHCSNFLCCTPCIGFALSIVGCHKDGFAIWNLEYCNNQSCYKEYEFYLVYVIGMNSARSAVPLLVGLPSNCNWEPKLFLVTQSSKYRSRKHKACKYWCILCIEKSHWELESCPLSGIKKRPPLGGYLRH